MGSGSSEFDSYIKGIRHRYSVARKTQHSFSKGGVRFALEPCCGAPRVIRCAPHHAMMHRVFVNVTQASEVRTLVAQQRIPILKPDLPARSVNEFIHRPQAVTDANAGSVRAETLVKQKRPQNDSGWETPPRPEVPNQFSEQSRSRVSQSKLRRRRDPNTGTLPRVAAVTM